MTDFPRTRVKMTAAEFRALPESNLSESRFWRGRQECRPYSAMVTRRDAIFRVRDDRESQIRDSLNLRHELIDGELYTNEGEDMAGAKDAHQKNRDALDHLPRQPHHQRRVSHSADRCLCG